MSTQKKATLEKFALEIKRITEEKTERPRTKKGVIRELFTEIESANLLGYSFQDILKTMKDNGFDSNFKLQTFYTVMTKIRKERESKNICNPAEHQPPTTNSTEPQEKEPISQFSLPEQKPKGDPAPPAPAPAPVGIVDVFSKQAEREAKKNSEVKIQKIPRR